MINKLKEYSRTLAIAKEMTNRINALKRAIAESEDKMQRAKEKKSDSRIARLMAIKEARVIVLEQLMDEFESQSLAVEKMLEQGKDVLTPLEIMIISKRYIEGLSWAALIEQLHTRPEYASFRYERSAYMRAHKSALDKIMTMEEER